MEQDIDLNGLKNVLAEEMNGLEYEQLNNDGTNTCLMFKATKYRLEFLNNLKEFQENEKFCDVVLKTQSTSGSSAISVIKAHKLVLASASPYFKAMFAGGFKENRNCDEIFIDHINDFTLKTIIDFIYTSQLVIKENNVQHLLVASKMLQIEDIVVACCAYLYLNMDASNCIGFEGFANTYGCSTLAK